MRISHKRGELSIQNNLYFSFLILHTPRLSLFLNSSLPRASIETSEEYNRIKSGEIYPDIDVILMTRKAHPEISSEPIYFRNASYYKLIFSDGEAGAYVSLYTFDRVVRVDVTRSGAMFDVPDHYKNYKFYFDYNVEATEAYLDSILKCKNAISLELSDKRSSLAGKLFARVNEMNEMTELRSFDLTIHFDDRDNFAFAPFFELPALKYVTFRLGAFSRDEYEEFIAVQQIPVGWQRRRELELDFPSNWYRLPEVIHTYYKTD